VHTKLGHSYANSLRALWLSCIQVKYTRIVCATRRAPTGIRYAPVKAAKPVVNVQEVNRSGSQTRYTAWEPKTVWVSQTLRLLSTKLFLRKHYITSMLSVFISFITRETA